MTTVYVSNADSAELSVLRLDAARATLTEVQRVEAAPMVMPLALNPAQTVLYAAVRSEPWQVLSFAIDAASGRLARLGAAPLPHSMAYLATDRRGRFLFSASYGGDQIAVGPIDARGVAQAAQQTIATGRHAHAIEADPSNRFVLATVLGAGHVLQLHFDAATGQLTPNTPPAVAPHERASPRHFVFGPATEAAPRFVYLINELDAAVDVLAFDSAAGTLRTLQTVSSLPDGFHGEPWASDLHLSPDGRFLYVSERRSNTLAIFGVDATTGLLTRRGTVAAPAQPRSFAITPDGRFLIAVGQQSNTVGLYAIDAQSGALNPCGETAVGRNPSAVVCVALGA